MPLKRINGGQSSESYLHQWNTAENSPRVTQLITFVSAQAHARESISW